MRLMDGLPRVPDGFGATCNPEAVDLADRLLAVLPWARPRICERLRGTGVIYLVPHPETPRSTPAPAGWVVNWGEQLRYTPEAES